MKNDGGEEGLFVGLTEDTGGAFRRVFIVHVQIIRRAPNKICICFVNVLVNARSMVVLVRYSNQTTKTPSLSLTNGTLRTNEGQTPPPTAPQTPPPPPPCSLLYCLLGLRLPGCRSPVVVVSVCILCQGHASPRYPMAAENAHNAISLFELNVEHVTATTTTKRSRCTER